jgi:ABC-2 type transport system ATP-binding protein
MDAMAIRTTGLTKHYGDFTAVDGLDLEVGFGEVFGLLGPNGAGKTTTILMLLGLTERSEGEVEVLGLDPARHPLEVKRQVGYLPDEVGFYGNLTGRQNLRFTGRLNRLEARAAETRIDELLAEVGLTEAADKPVETYSRGMRQRLGLADVLIKDPRIVVLDEPTAAIDPVGVLELLAVIRRLAVDHGVAVLLSSHLLPQVERICDRVGIFVRGRMVEQGTVQELAARMPAHEVLVEVGVDGDPETTRAALAAIPGMTVREQHRLDPRIWTIAADTDRRRELVGTLLAQGLPVFQVSRVGIELDALYQRYFQQAEEEAADAAVA